MTPTSSPSLTPLSATEELIVAQSLAYYRDMKTVAENAPYGQFLNDAEAVALSKGRERIRQSLETIAQEIDDSEKKRNENVSEMPKEKTASGIPKQKRRHSRRNRKAKKTLRRRIVFVTD